MPRKTGQAGRGARPTSCFNEAAARCHGKQAGMEHAAFLLGGASMRPRPDATENMSWAT